MTLAGHKLASKHKLTCEICGGLFKSKLSRAKFCSMSCKNKKAMLKLKRKKCKACTLEYQPTNATQKYCSASCGLSNTKVVRQVTCVDCLCDFTHQGRGRRLRCTECQKIDANRRAYDHAVARCKIEAPGAGKGGNQHGPKNHQWLGGVARSYKGNYRVLCFHYWDRECVVCGETLDIQVHHVNGNIKDDSPTNLIPLCCEHHWQVHSKRKQTSVQLINALEKIWSNCRCKIAEKIRGTPEVDNPS